MVASVALAVLNEVAQPAMLSEVRRKGERMMSRLRGLQSALIEDVRGLGLMIGVRLNVDPKRVMKAAWSQQLLITTAGMDIARFLPPLTATDDELDDAVDRFAAVLAEIG